MFHAVDSWFAMSCSILSAMFSDVVLAHFRSPHNAGDLPDATATVEVTNPVCGDVLRLAVRVEDGRVAAARFKTQGCVAAIASSSVLTDLLTGKSPAEARRITPQQISEALAGLPPATFHAAQLCADAVAALVRKL
jgi:nitrogen fixation NifU-like protein